MFAELFSEKWGEGGFPLPRGFMRKDTAALAEHLGQIAQTKLGAEPPQDHKADDIAWVLQAGGGRAGALVKLSSTPTTAKPAVPQTLHTGPLRECPVPPT